VSYNAEIGKILILRPCILTIVTTARKQTYVYDVTAATWYTSNMAALAAFAIAENMTSLSPHV